MGLEYRNPFSQKPIEVKCIKCDKNVTNEEFMYVNSVEIENSMSYWIHYTPYCIKCFKIKLEKF